MIKIKKEEEHIYDKYYLEIKNFKICFFEKLNLTRLRKRKKELENKENDISKINFNFDK